MRLVKWGIVLFCPIIILLITFTFCLAAGGPWEGVRLAIGLRFYDLAQEDLLHYTPLTKEEKERRELALAYINLKEGNIEEATRHLDAIPPDSIYYEPAQALSWEREVQVEEVKALVPKESPAWKVFLTLFPSELVEGLDYLRLNREFLYKGEWIKGLNMVFKEAFWQGRDDLVLGMPRQFPQLARDQETLWMLALSRERRGEHLHALSLLFGLPSTPRNDFWRAKVLSSLGRETEAESYLKRASRGEGFYGLWAALVLGREIPKVYCPPPKSIGYPILNRLLEMGLGDLADKLVMDWLWEGRASLRDVMPFLLKYNPYLAIKLSYALGGVEERGKESYCVRYPMPHRSLVRLFSRFYDLDESLIYAVMRQESLFEREAVSKSRAMGLMQILPSTGDMVSRMLKDEVFLPEKLYLPFFNLRYGVWYLKYLMERFNGSLPLVIAAYNAGPEEVSRWYARFGLSHPEEVAEYFPKAETRNYVKSVLSNYIIYALSIAPPPPGSSPSHGGQRRVPRSRKRPRTPLAR